MNDFTHDERLGQDEGINCTECGENFAEYFDDGDTSLCDNCYVALEEINQDQFDQQADYEASV